MREHDFEVLKVTAAIAPQSANWPRPDFSKMKLPESDGMAITGIGDPHWDAIHSAVNAAREVTLKASGAMSAISSDRSLSPSGKAERKKEIATKQLGELEKSKALDRARNSVEKQVAAWDAKLDLSPKAPDNVGLAMQYCEIRSHLAALKSTERVAFINAHAMEVGDAVLSAPAFLSGLTPAELGVVRQRYATIKNPEIARLKDETLNALAVVERGFRAAANQIRDAAGLEKPFDGVAE